MIIFIVPGHTPPSSRRTALRCTLPPSVAAAVAPAEPALPRWGFRFPLRRSTSGAGRFRRASGCTSFLVGPRLPGRRTALALVLRRLRLRRTLTSQAVIWEGGCSFPFSGN